LEIAGRDLYIREGCYLCHSQQIRPLAHEVLRYGPPSTIEESMYDHPFQWGSKRTGPDLARVGKKYPNLWHFRHMINPRTGEKNTEHSENPVPFILVDHERQYENPQGIDHKTVGGMLSDIAPTILEIMDIPKAEEMTGTSLLESI
jgi:cbb3-type cytochrome c oxidase subunit II